MFKQYLVTGATGFLGRALLAELENKGGEIRALALENDPHLSLLPPSVLPFPGDVRDPASLEAFFHGAGPDSCVIHCAGIISVASKPGDIIYKVNVEGTAHVLEKCLAHKVGKLVYVSSVHAIPEKPPGEVMTEETVFDPELVQGAYAKTKAIASLRVLEAASRGLNASLVFPSGIIGPGDGGANSITHMLGSYLKGKLPLAVKGAYDFVDVRDVARGIAACTEKGKPGKGYILSGHYITIKEMLELAGKSLPKPRPFLTLPYGLAKLAAPAYEAWSRKKGQPLFFTPYAISVLHSNGRFSRRAAEEELGYAPRPLEDSLRDMVRWIQASQSEEAMV